MTLPAPINEFSPILIPPNIVELAPSLDPSGISSVVGAKATRSLLMLLSMT